MGFNKNLKKAMFWLRRKSHLPMLIVVAISVVMLVFNDDTSIAVSKKYQDEINELQEQIRVTADSAQYYRQKREAIEAGRNELEHLARERFNMQRSTEDVYIVTEKDDK